MVELESGMTMRWCWTTVWSFPSAGLHQARISTRSCRRAKTTLWRTCNGNLH